MATTSKRTSQSIQHDYPHIFLTPYIIHYINLMKNFGEIDKVKHTMKHTQIVTRFIHNHYGCMLRCKTLWREKSYVKVLQGLRHFISLKSLARRICLRDRINIPISYAYEIGLTLTTLTYQYHMLWEDLQI